jgi:ATP diphosphatase
MDEIEAEIDARDAEKVAGEVGDLLFAVANLARHLAVDPEGALRGANAKFERRFGYIEERLAADGRAPGDASLEEMEELWNEAKRLERAGR